MALITCPDCGKEISNKAEKCLKCGAPISKTLKANLVTEAQEEKNNINKNSKDVSLLLAVGIFIVPHVFSWFTLKKGYSKKSRIVAFSWLLLFIMLILAKPILEAMEAESSKKLNENTGTQKSIQSNSSKK